MARDRQKGGSVQEPVISIIGPGMTVVGDCDTEGTLRVEGTVRGSITAGKAVVVGKEGVVEGDIHTQDAVLAGHVTGTLTAESRLELQGSSRVDGDVRARRMRLEEGAMLNGTVLMGEDAEFSQPFQAAGRAEADAPEDAQENAGPSSTADSAELEVTAPGEPVPSARVGENG